MLLLEPGLRKTSIMLAGLKAMRKAKAVKNALVVAPLRVAYGVWTHDGDGELAKWEEFRDDFQEVLLHGDHKMSRLQDDGNLYVVNFDGLQWITACSDCGHQSHLSACAGNGKARCKCRTKRGAPLDFLIHKKGVDTLVVDELSKMKHAKTKRFKALKPFLSQFRRRYGLTGSPAANGLEGLFGQAYTIDLGKTLGQYITHYRFTFFTPKGFGGYTWVPKSKETEAAIYERMRNLALAMKAEDHLPGLPKLVPNTLWVDLPPQVRKVYDELEEELFTIIDREEVTAANSAVASNKCRQVASGGIYIEKVRRGKLERVTKHLHDEKTEALVDLIDELQGKSLLVGYEFHHDLERIREAVPEAEVLGSGTSPKETADIVARWNRKEIPVLCGHPASMGHGLNLQGGGHHAAWYTASWDYEMKDQFIRRELRSGQKESRVFEHTIAARRTVDETVIRALHRKEKGQNAMFAALKEYRAARRSGE
jgi:SNF2 family DNA or RNA helicase